MIGAALAGALAGALLGRATGSNNTVRGAALGAAGGALACLAVNVQSRQTKTAAQADRDFRQSGGKLAPQPTLVSYASQTNSSSVQRGQVILVNSSAEIVNGSVEQIREVREELIIVGPDGQTIRNANKPFTAGSAGRFENTFEVKMPASASQGTYGLKTNLYVNGNLSGTRDLRTQVVWNGESSTLLASN